MLNKAVLMRRLTATPELKSWCAYSDGGWYTDCDESPLYWSPLPKYPRRYNINDSNQ